MLNFRKDTGGNSLATILAVIVLIVAAAAIVAVYRHNHDRVAKQPSASQGGNNSTSADPYVGWSVATSDRAKLSVKYPSSWTYSSDVGNKDNVEHISIKGTKLVLRIDSYNGKDPANGGSPYTTCIDCKDTLSTQSLTIPKLGAVNMETVTYSLDNGKGNALILRQPNNTYYIPSPDAPNVYTTFRGISILDSLQAYQNETPAEFTGNADYSTALLILKSLSY